MNNYIVVLGKTISFYSIIGCMGFIAALIFCALRRKRYGIERMDMVNMFAYAIIGILVGSKLLAIICMIPQFIEYWDVIVWSREFVSAVMQNGFVFYGGLIGVILAVYLYCRQFGLPFLRVMELAAPAIPLFHSIGRIGCYVGGCCYGIDGFPIQLVEAAGNLLIFGILLWIQERKRSFDKTFPLYLIIYAVMRFTLEFFRGDPERGFVGLLSVSQWISAGLLAAGVWLMGFDRRTVR